MTSLRKIIAQAIFDPGAIIEKREHHTLTGWQTDAVMQVLSDHIESVAIGDGPSVPVIVMGPPDPLDGPPRRGHFKALDIEPGGPSKDVWVDVPPHLSPAGLGIGPNVSDTPKPETPTRARETANGWPFHAPPLMGDGRPAWLQMSELIDKIRLSDSPWRQRDELVAMFLWAKYGWSTRNIPSEPVADANRRRLVAEAFVNTEMNYAALTARAETAERQLAKAIEALTASGSTKAAYIGEFTIAVERFVNDDEEPDDETESARDPYEHITVPWTTIKEIMAAIKARSLTKDQSNG